MPISHQSATLLLNLDNRPPLLRLLLDLSLLLLLLFILLILLVMIPLRSRSFLQSLNLDPFAVVVLLEFALGGRCFRVELLPLFRLFDELGGAVRVRCREGRGGRSETKAQRETKG